MEPGSHHSTINGNGVSKSGATARHQVRTGSAGTKLTDLGKGAIDEEITDRCVCCTLWVYHYGGFATLSGGLILHYGFDDVFSGSLQNDGTGTIIGSPVGATQTSEGYINKAYEFDGVGDHILMQPSTDFGVQRTIP